jgi:Short C-terminal domain
VDGRVESYGRFLELFDVYNRPVTHALPAGELQKLKALKDEGALTDQEFQRAKAKLLAP